MRIAILPDDYLPNSTLSHAKMLHELAVEFIRLGHEVVVITPGLPKQADRLIKSNIDGVQVWRFRSGQTRGVGNIKRTINESALSHNAWQAIKNEVNNKPFDLCVNYSPTIFFGLLVRKFKSKYNTRIYLILRDLFPQWIIDEGIISEKSLPAVYFRFFEKLNYDAADFIGLMSEANLSLFQEMHPKRRNLGVLRNWANILPVKRVEPKNNIRELYRLQDKVIFFYGGNIGHAQDMGNVIRLVAAMKKHEEAHFFFVGQGDQFNMVEEMRHMQSLTNLTLLESVSQEVYAQILTQVDVGLFSLAKTHKAHNFPGKVLGYMSQSIPVLGSLNPGNDLVDFLNDKNAGFALINEDDQGLYDAAKELLFNKELRNSTGVNGHEVLVKCFSVNKAAQTILDHYTLNPEKKKESLNV